jgi:hypothetical protein
VQGEALDDHRAEVGAVDEPAAEAPAGHRRPLVGAHDLDRRRGGLGDEVLQPRAEGTGQRLERLDRRVGPPGLELGQRALRETREAAELHEGQPARQPQAPEVRSHRLGRADHGAYGTGEARARDGM